MVQDVNIGATGGSSYALLIVLAAFCYALNVNLLKYRLQGLGAMAIALGNFVAIIGPAVLVLILTPFSIRTAAGTPDIMTAMGYIFILAFFGTALAKVMFNELVAIASPVFSISVTYLLPIVAIGWGLLDGEAFGLQQWLACGLILLGVALATERKKQEGRLKKRPIFLYLRKTITDEITLVCAFIAHSLKSSCPKKIC